MSDWDTANPKHTPSLTYIALDVR